MIVFKTKKIKLISTNYGYINLPMLIFLRDHNLDKIIHSVSIPNFRYNGEIGYQYKKII